MAISRVDNRYWDVKADPTIGQAPLEWTGIEAFIGSIHNLFRTKVGDRGATFRPEWGNYLYLMLHEPINDFTAFKIKTFIMEDIRRCQPLAKLDLGNTRVVPVLANRFPGFSITIAIISTPLIASPFSFTFTAIPS